MQYDRHVAEWGESEGLSTAATWAKENPFPHDSHVLAWMMLQVGEELWRQEYLRVWTGTEISMDVRRKLLALLKVSSQ